MRDIQKEIQENLDAIEERYKVKILLAVESGSRAWGISLRSLLCATITELPTAHCTAF